MWVMTNYGILMPALRPEADDGLPLQVRARDKQALRELIKRMNRLELPHGPIVATPEMDYDYRLYTTHEAFAQVIAADIRSINYRKFKPTAKTHALHDLYTQIWAVVFDHYAWRRSFRDTKM